MKTYTPSKRQRSEISGVKRTEEGILIEGIPRAGIKLTEGETLEAMIRKMISQGEPIGADVGLVGNDERGENEKFDITTDKFDSMVRAKGKVVQLGVDAKVKAAEAKAAKAKNGEGGDSAN